MGGPKDYPDEGAIEIEKRLAWALLSKNDGIRETAQKELLKLILKAGKNHE